MKRREIIRAGIIVILVLGAGLIFFLLHYNMPSNHETPAISQKEASFKNINANQLSEMLKNKDPLLVNVHSPYMGEIRGTDDFIFLSDIKDNLDKFPSDKNAQIVVYCQSGGMSRIAAQDLADMGYTNVFNLSGGMIGWKQAGYQLDFIKANKK